MYKFPIFTGVILLLGIILVPAFADIQYAFEFGSTGTGIDELNNPTDLIITPDGNKIYVVDSENNRINVFEDDGDHDFEFGTFCSIFSISNCNDNADGANSDGDGQFDTPFGITIDDSGDIFVVDSENYRIQKFNDDGVFELKFGSTDSSENSYLPDPRGIAIFESTNEIFVSNIATDAISVFDSTGNFVFDFDSFGSGDFLNPSYLLIDNTEDILYVSDSGNDQIVMFQLVTGTTCPSDTTEITDGVCFVEKFGTTGSDDGEFDSPGGLAIDTVNNLLYVSDTDNDRIQALSLVDVSETAGPTPPQNVRAMSLSPDSLLVAWDEPNSEITGYKIELREGSGSYSVLIDDTKNNAISFVHEGLDSNIFYNYRIYAINDQGTSNPTSSSSIKPQHSTTPAGLVADAISPTQIKLSWHPPSDTFNQSITGYEVKRVLSSGVYDTIDSTDSTTYIVNNLETGKTYSFAVSASLGTGATNESNEASATPLNNSVENSQTPSIKPKTAPSAPTNLKATPISLTQINLSWDLPSTGSDITGYKIEFKKNSGSFTVLVDDTETALRSFQHKNLSNNSQYTYRVSAINSIGTSPASSEVTSTPLAKTLQLEQIGTLVTDEKKQISFTVKPTDSSFGSVVYSLSSMAPVGATINSQSGLFTWTPTDTQGGQTYVFDIVGMQGSMIDTVSAAITVNDMSEEPEPAPQEPEVPAPFVDKTKDPQSYVDRYFSEAAYKEWFDENYPEYDSIYHAVGLEAPVELAPFVDPARDPQSYVDRYLTDSEYKEWFDENYPEYDSIYQAVGLPEPIPIASFVEKDPRYYVVRYNYEPDYKEWFDENYPEYDSIYQAVGLPEKEITNYGYCGEGTKLVDGVCTVTKMSTQKSWWQFW